MQGDLSTIVTNLATGLRGPFWTLLFALAALIGTIYAISVLWKLVQSNSLPGTPPVSNGEVFAVLVIAAFMLNMSGFLGKVSSSLGMGTISYGAIDYPGAASFGQLAPAVNAVLTLAAMGGGLFAFKGILLLKRASSGGGQAGDDTVWSAATHLIGGVLLINIVQLVDALRQSTGGLW
jgi:hypothetical protein